MLPQILLVLAQAQAPAGEPPSTAVESQDAQWKTTASALETRQRTAADLSRAVESLQVSSAGDAERLTALRTAAQNAVDVLGARSQNAARISRATASSWAPVCQAPWTRT